MAIKTKIAYRLGMLKALHTHIILPVKKKVEERVRSNQVGEKSEINFINYNDEIVSLINGIEKKLAAGNTSVEAELKALEDKFNEIKDYNFKGDVVPSQPQPLPNSTIGDLLKKYINTAGQGIITLPEHALEQLEKLKGKTDLYLTQTTNHALINSIEDQQKRLEEMMPQLQERLTRETGLSSEEAAKAAAELLEEQNKAINELLKQTNKEIDEKTQNQLAETLAARQLARHVHGEKFDTTDLGENVFGGTAPGRLHSVRLKQSATMIDKMKFLVGTKILGLVTRLFDQGWKLEPSGSGWEIKKVGYGGEGMGFTSPDDQERAIKCFIAALAEKDRKEGHNLKTRKLTLWGSAIRGREEKILRWATKFGYSPENVTSNFEQDPRSRDEKMKDKHLKKEETDFAGALKRFRQRHKAEQVEREHVVGEYHKAGATAEKQQGESKHPGKHSKTVLHATDESHVGRASAEKALELKEEATLSDAAAMLFMNAKQEQQDTWLKGANAEQAYAVLFYNLKGRGVPYGAPPPAAPTPAGGMPVAGLAVPAAGVAGPAAAAGVGAAVPAAPAAAAGVGAEAAAAVPTTLPSFPSYGLSAARRADIFSKLSPNKQAEILFRGFNVKESRFENPILVEQLVKALNADTAFELFIAIYDKESALKKLNLNDEGRIALAHQLVRALPLNVQKEMLTKPGAENYFEKSGPFKEFRSKLEIKEMYPYSKEIPEKDLKYHFGQTTYSHELNARLFEQGVLYPIHDPKKFIKFCDLFYNQVQSGDEVFLNYSTRPADIIEQFLIEAPEQRDWVFFLNTIDVKAWGAPVLVNHDDLKLRKEIISNILEKPEIYREVKLAIIEKLVEKLDLPPASAAGATPPDSLLDPITALINKENPDVLAAMLMSMTSALAQSKFFNMIDKTRQANVLEHVNDPRVMGHCLKKLNYTDIKILFKKGKPEWQANFVKGLLSEKPAKEVYEEISKEGMVGLAALAANYKQLDPADQTKLFSQSTLLLVADPSAIVIFKALLNQEANIDLYKRILGEVTPFDARKDLFESLDSVDKRKIFFAQVASSLGQEQLTELLLTKPKAPAPEITQAEREILLASIMSEATRQRVIISMINRLAKRTDQQELFTAQTLLLSLAERTSPYQRVSVFEKLEGSNIKTRFFEILLKKDPKLSVENAAAVLNVALKENLFLFRHLADLLDKEDPNYTNAVFATFQKLAQFTPEERLGLIKALKAMSDEEITRRDDNLQGFVTKMMDAKVLTRFWKLLTPVQQQDLFKSAESRFRNETSRNKFLSEVLLGPSSLQDAEALISSLSANCKRSLKSFLGEQKSTLNPQQQQICDSLIKKLGQSYYADVVRQAPGGLRR